MRGILAGLAFAVVVTLAAAPAGNGWAWRTHGGTFGSRGISMVALWRIQRDHGVPSTVRENLDSFYIMAGSVAPDRWKGFEDIGERPHVSTWVENRGENWLLRARDLVAAGGNIPWDNVSYILGIFSHYWSEQLAYVHHDNAKRYFENLYGPADYYQVWKPIHDHFEVQVKYYRPKDPALIVSPVGGVTVVPRYATAEPDPLVDGTPRRGIVTGGSLADTQGMSADGNYEQISEQNIGSVSYAYVTSESVIEGGTTGVSGAQADDGVYENIYEIDYGGAGGSTTYDYSSGAGVNKWAYEGLGGNDAPPADNTSGTEITNYSDIATSNDVRLVNTSAGGKAKNPFHRFKFQINEDPSTVTQIDYHWEGCGSTDVTPNNSLYIWNVSTSSWTLLGNNNAGHPTDGTVSGSITSGISDYIAPGGLVQLCVSGITDAQDYVYTDYVRLTIHAVAGPQYRENVQHNISGVPGGYSGYELQVRYYLSGDSEKVSVYLYNFSTGDWDNLGNISSTTPTTFTYTLTGTNYIGPGPDNVRVRFVQRNNDPTQTSLMVDYTRVAYGNLDYRLNWEHRITGVVTGRDNYTLKIYGRRGADEIVNVHVRNFSTGEWEPVGSLNTVDSLLSLFINGPNIGSYLSGGAMSVRYSQPDADATQTTIHLDFVVLEERFIGGAGNPYGSLEAFFDAARPELYAFFDSVMNPDDWSQGWFHDWIRSRKCESSDYSVYAGNPAGNVHYGTKELVDMATELVYSGWAYALNIQENVTSDRILWSQWWSRSHRTPGIIYA